MRIYINNSIIPKLKALLTRDTALLIEFKKRITAADILAFIDTQLNESYSILNYINSLPVENRNVNYKDQSIIELTNELTTKMLEFEISEIVTSDSKFKIKLEEYL